MGFMKAFCAAYRRNCLCLVCEGKASRIKRAAAQDQAGSSKAARVKREFIKRVAAGANSPEAVRKIYAKRQGKFKAKS
ncbi:hypothetical protein JLA62_000035 [Campylobacter upsaliensis]|nr:hypothetical protein [Campylobacter upsaliensis]